MGTRTFVLFGAAAAALITLAACSSSRDAFANAG